MFKVQLKSLSERPVYETKKMLYRPAERIDKNAQVKGAHI